MKTINFVKTINPLTNTLMGYICKQNLGIYIQIENGMFALYFNGDLHSGWTTLKDAREVAAELL